MNATKAILAAGLGLAVLLAGVAMGRRPAVEPTRPSPRSIARPAASIPEEPPATMVPAPSAARAAALPSIEPPSVAAVRAQRRADREFWEDLGALVELRPTVAPAKYREHVTSITTDYLGFEKARAAAFEQTATRAVDGIGRAWKARDDALLALPAWLTSDDRSRKEREIQGRYEDAKRQEVERVEALLDATPRHLQFRNRLAEWIDAVR